MTSELGYLAAFLMGVFGSAHCIGMCGGLAWALSLGLPERVRSSPGRMLPYQLAYNAGRITSYAIAGAVWGFLGAHAIGFMPPHVVRTAGLAISAMFFLGLGLYLANWWQGFGVVERVGARAWRYFKPLTRRLLPVRGPLHAVLFGLIWGWLPCGLVYAALAWSLVAADPFEGAMRMLVFGLGTLPMLLLIGISGGWLGRAIHSQSVRRAAGVLMIAAGVAILLGTGHHHSETHSAGATAYAAQRSGA